MTGRHDLVEIAPPEEAERLYSILVTQGRLVFEDEFRRALPDVELCWPKRDKRHVIYRWQKELDANKRAAWDRREEEARRQSEGK
jgi:hypothetical protein